MRLYKALFAAMAASVLLGALVSSAAARNISTSSPSWRATFSAVRLDFPVGIIGCSATLEGSFHTRTLAKIAGSLVGYVTRATLGACDWGSHTILTETLPWHMTYRNFTGTLPNISSAGFNVIGWSQRIRESAFISCLFRSTVARPALLTFYVSSRVARSAGVGGTIPSDCGTDVGLSSDSAPVTVAGAATTITVTLI